MRTKPHLPPAKRRRTACVHPTASSPRLASGTIRWAHAEWFVSSLDEPYFTHSEFRGFIANEMGLGALLTDGATRRQWACVRSAMCGAVPGGLQPRRLSQAFLDAERAELETYRRDARRLLRDEALLSATDATTGNPLPPEWWSRYLCPPPFPPLKGGAVRVRIVKDADVVVDEEEGKTPRCLPHAATSVVNATFVGLEGDAENRIKVTETERELVVSDLDVMSVAPPPFLIDTLLNTSPSPLIRQYIDNRGSPTTAFLGLSPSTSFPDPSTALDLSRYPDAPPSLIQIYQTPRKHILLSPQRSVAVKSRNRKDIECEIDVEQLAESQRLLNRKEELIVRLKAINDSVSSMHLATQEIDEDVLQEYASVAGELDIVNAQLAPFFILNQNQTTGLTPDRRRDDFEVPVMQSLETTPEPKKSSLFLTRPGVFTPSREKLQGSRTTPTGFLPGARSRPLRPEHMAKNVDFRTATGSALLAKALTRSCFSKLSVDSILKSAPTGVRADVMECVSACVAVLVRARATRSFDCIQEVIEGIRSRYPENSEALEAIHAAARTFESSSSESS